MEYNTIKAILEKYWEGAASLEQEKMLKRYFAQANIASDLEEYRPLFQYFEMEQTMTLSDDFDAQFLTKIEASEQSNPPRIRQLYRWVASAAAAVFLLSASFFAYQGYEQTEQKKGATVIVLEDAEDAEEAYAKVKAALFMVSSKMNKGTGNAKKGLVKINALNKIRR